MRLHKIQRYAILGSLGLKVGQNWTDASVVAIAISKGKVCGDQWTIHVVQRLGAVS
ncbi:hypothetical protein Csa_016412, partial [Cucumis sativus]